MGTCNFCIMLITNKYKGASHNRFEHSVGTYHLAGEFLKHLNTIQPHLKITEREIKCVKLAGLCHDLGHGPFSHFFADYLRKMRPECNWEHENASELMLEHIVKKYSKINVDEYELNFIKDLIHGMPRSSYLEANKQYLFEIVANKRNSIDVDKLDYIQRDCYNIGIKYSVDAMRLIKLSRVIDNQICFNSKEAFNIFQLYHTRYILFKCAYTHRVTQAIELMVSDVLCLADEKYQFSSSIFDMEKYKLLSDTVIERIYADNLVPASCELIDRIYRRDLYRFVNQLIFPPGEKKRGIDFFTPANISSFRLESSTLSPDDIYVIAKKIDFTMSENNPLSAIRFFDKNNAGVSYVLPPARMSLLIPEIFEETTLRIFVKHESKEFDTKVALKAAFLHFKKSFNDSLTQILSW